MKKDLLEETCVCLLKQGFTVKSLTRSCFDVIARQGSKILLLKILEDANSISPDFAQEMARISSYMSASPVIVAEKAGKELNNNIIYSRFGIYTLNLDTLRNCLENKRPIVKQSRAGLTLSVAGDRLKKKRAELGYSLTDLSRRVGVSRRMILKYEDGSDISLENARKMHRVLGENVFKHVDIFEIEKDIRTTHRSAIAKKYDHLGFDVIETKRAPFDMVAKKQRELILTEVSDVINPNFDSITRLLDALNLVIFKRKKPKRIPALTKKEFLEFDDGKELIKFVKEY